MNKVTIQEANILGAYIVCTAAHERDRMVKLLHSSGIVHITTGQKNVQDYYSRAKRKFYSDENGEHLVISLYRGDFFAILPKVVNDNYIQLSSMLFESQE